MDSLLSSLIVLSNIGVVIATLVAVHHANGEAQETAREAIKSENSIAHSALRLFGKNGRHQR